MVVHQWWRWADGRGGDGGGDGVVVVKVKVACLAIQRSGPLTARYMAIRVA